MNEYIIVADYDIYGKEEECLVCLAGYNKEEAEKLLATPERYAHMLKKGKNPRLKVIEKEDAWWRQGSLD